MQNYQSLECWLAQEKLVCCFLETEKRLFNRRKKIMEKLSSWLVLVASLVDFRGRKDWRSSPKDAAKVIFFILLCFYINLATKSY